MNPRALLSSPNTLLDAFRKETLTPERTPTAPAGVGGSEEALLSSLAPLAAQSPEGFKTRLELISSVALCLPILFFRPATIDHLIAVVP